MSRVKSERQALKDARDEVEVLKGALARAEAAAKEARKLRADDLVTTVRMHRRAMAAESAFRSTRDLVDGALKGLRSIRMAQPDLDAARGETDKLITEFEHFLGNLPSDEQIQADEQALHGIDRQDQARYDAADPREHEIDRLTEQVERSDDEKKRIAHERDEVKAALRPFAVLGRMLRSGSFPDSADIWGYNEATLTVGDFRRAASVLMGADHEPQPQPQAS